MSAATPTSSAPRLAWIVLAIVLVAEVMDLIDGTIVNVAGPSIRDDLGAGATTLQWLTAAYTLAFAVLLVTGARLGDRFGRRRLFIVGVIGFTVSSAICALSQSAETLIAARVTQGAFGALLIPQGFGMIKEVFPEDQQQKAFAAFGPVIGLSAVIAPILGGALIDLDLLGSGWRLIFLINLPLGAIGLWGALKFMPRTAGANTTRLDPAGAVLLTAASFAVIYPLVQGRELDWPAWIFAMLGAGVALFAVFGLHERRHAETALIAPTLLRNRVFTSGLVVAICFFSAMVGLMLVLSLFCQLGEGFGPLKTGLAIAPFAFGVALGAPASFPLSQRLGRMSMQLGFTIMGGGLVLLSVMVTGADDVTPWTLMPGELLAGIGMGLALPPLFDFILAGVSDHEVGSASGVLNAVQQFGSAVGIAVLATVFFGYFDDTHDAVHAMSATALWSLVPLGLALAATQLLPREPRMTGAAH